MFHMCVCVRAGAVKGAKGGGGGGEDDEQVPSRLDIRVGKIISVEKVRSQFQMPDHLLRVSSDVW